MARALMLLSFALLVVSSTVLQGSNAVTYSVNNNVPTTPGGQRFNNEIGADYSIKTMSSATEFIWRVFQQNTEADRKNVQQVTLNVDVIDTEGVVAYTSNDQITYSVKAIENESGDLKRGFDGVLYHEMAHVWQWSGNGAPGGLIEGIADFVRLRAGYIPSGWAQPGQGDRWDEGYSVTARFLDYCNSLKNGFVAEINNKMKDGNYSDNYFVEILGKPVDQLWSEYKATYQT